MALDKFRSAPLPNPPAQYDPQYIRQFIRVLETYFSQLDSRTPNNAEQYSADRFVGGSFSGTSISVDDASTTTLEAVSGEVGDLAVNYVDATYVDTEALNAQNAEITTLMLDSAYGGSFYGDGRYLSTPYNQLISNSDQTAASVATAYAVTFDTTDFPDGISVVSSSQITFADPGIYNITYSIQLKNTNNDLETVDIWLRYNNNDLANSNTRFAVPARKSTGDPSYLVAVTPLMVDVTAANDQIQIMWRVSNTAVTIEQLPAVTASPGVTPAIPATPSVIVGVTFISAQFPPVTRVAPLPVFGFGQVGDISVVIR
jgi:hypothetical protein